MSAGNIGTGWHLDTFGSDVAVSSEPDLVGSETPRAVRFVLWSDVLPEPLGFRSWSETVTAAASLPVHSLCHVHSLRTGVEGEVPATAIEVYTGLVGQLPLEAPTA